MATDGRLAMKDAAKVSSSGSSSSSSVDYAWKLLEVMIQRLERKGETGIHKAVVSRIFSQGMSALPAWLVAAYKRVRETLGFNVKSEGIEPHNYLFNKTPSGISEKTQGVSV